MRLTLAAFRGRFARRLFSRFLLAAVLPIAVVAILAYANTSRIVTDQARQRLENSSHDIGLRILDRLNRAEELLRQFNKAGALHIRDEQNPFLSIVRYVGETRRDVVFTTPGSQPEEHPNLTRRARDAPGETVLKTSTGRVLMARAFSLDTGGTQTLVARLNPIRLWGTPEIWPAATRFCIFSVPNADAINCEQFRGAYTRDFAGPRHDGASPRRIAFTTLDGQPVVAASWELFLRSQFLASDWRIVAIQPRAYALRTAHAFYRLLPLVLAISLLCAGLIGLAQIRRISSPLRRLRAGVHRIAEGAFEARVAIQSADEFEELGHSVNQMAERLGKQFHALETLSVVDRAILNSTNIDVVVRNVLPRMQRMLECTTSAVIAFDANAPAHSRLVVAGCDVDGVSTQAMALSAAQVDELDTPQSSVYLDAKQIADRAYLHAFTERGIRSLIAVPVREQGRLWAAMFLGYRDAAAETAADVEQAQSVADRLAVALAASDRDAQLHRQAHYDSLTDLPNRKLFTDRVTAHMGRAKNGGAQFALLFIDLDHFKDINDTVGHSAGDRLLVEVSRRAGKALRGVDTMARWGGDEFVVLLAGIGNRTAIDSMARRLIEAITDAYIIDDVEHRIDASIGSTVYPNDGATVETLLANADAAMYAAKHAGRGQHMAFERRMNQAIQDRLRLESELRQAMADDQFYLLYQPLIDVKSGQPERAEALLRWRSPEHGTVAPNEFIPTLEDTGLIVPVGAWVVRRACEQLASGFDPHGRAPARVAVNVSARQLWPDTFIDSVDEALTITGLAPSRLEIEITESMTLDDRHTALAVIGQLRERGVQVSMDDFGTGYSSLGALRQLPVETVKIDKSFVPGIEDPRSAAAKMMASMIQMLHALDRRVVVEGVETKLQLDRLRAVNADLVQGYYFTRPVEASAFYDAIHQTQTACASNTH